LEIRQKLAFVRISNKKPRAADEGGCQGFFFGLLSKEDQAERSEA
jgi:hypothetical protein